MSKKPAFGKHVPVGTAPLERILGSAPLKSKEGRVQRSRKLTKEEELPLVTVLASGPNRPRATRPYVALNGVSTIEPNKTRYSDEELEEFRDIVSRKLDEARKSYAQLANDLSRQGNGTTDTDPHNMGMEDGSETLERETNAHLAGRQERLVRDLEDAMFRIKNKTYGICRVTGRLISKERLRLVPHATLSVEAKVLRN